MKGIFYGVGVGPGDPELLTLKAINTVKDADIIIAPKTEKKETSTALKIARPYIGEKTEIVSLIFPMVFNNEMLNDAWENNKNIIVDYLKQGKKVVFLTLGDPMVYSTYMYIFRLLEDSGYEIITIPGITSFCAIASRLGIPLAEGNETISVVPATNDEEILEQALKNSDNLVLMKVYKNFNQVVKRLEESGHIEKSVMISKCGLADEEIYDDLQNVGEKKVNYLSTIIAKRRNGVAKSV